ncbi:sorcin-like isoform X2 [Branchiostoma lanceolatum]|uniref:sorcin-like isoform X2 n=1 Tax=Branchiostoma lanceolatum TaxID=7740 RepID=UPI00345712FF
MAYPGYQGQQPYGQPGYGGAYGAPPPQDPMWGYFTAVAGQDGQIDPIELQQCLTSSGISGSYQPFSLETCRVMIAMLDRDFSGKMGFNEFKELWAALNGWRSIYMQYDADRSGFINYQELGNCVRGMGYNLNPQTLNVLIKRYNKNGQITFDDFVACAVRLRALTDAFRRRDTAQQGMCTFQYDDFLQCTLCI